MADILFNNAKRTYASPERLANGLGAIVPDSIWLTIEAANRQGVALHACVGRDGILMVDESLKNLAARYTTVWFGEEA